ncbi:MAG: hypothetical protein JNN26_22145 [Candidatus Obscuribacter sp.]|nr:hypothetical protein [Candidatus Obscuribacter sp.]
MKFYGLNNKTIVSFRRQCQQISEVIVTNWQKQLSKPFLHALWLAVFQKACSMKPIGFQTAQRYGSAGGATST